MSSAVTAEEIGEGMAGFLRSEIVAPQVAFDADTPFRSIGLESISLVELLLFIERRFGVSVPEPSLTPANLASIASLARCVHQLADGPASSCAKPSGASQP